MLCSLVGMGITIWAQPLWVLVHTLDLEILHKITSASMRMDSDYATPEGQVDVFLSQTCQIPQVANIEDLII